MIAECFCGWQGLKSTMIESGYPVCPACGRKLSQLKCDGCSS